MRDYNRIEVGAVMGEIGRSGYRELRRLAKWLDNDGTRRSRRKGLLRIHNDYYFRYAPSIISRCEAEVFGLSIPRFAIRAYPVEPAGHEHLGSTKRENPPSNYINLRRVETFRKYAHRWAALPGSLGGMRLNETAYKKQPSEVLAEMEKKNRGISRIGDCLLTPPHWVSHFHTVQSYLGHILGEVPSDMDDTQGVPYLKHINLMGGGLCAQAVCFIATTLMHKYALGVHGLADITHLARGNVDGMLSLRGLNKPELSRYFCHTKVRLRGEWEILIGWNQHVTEPQMMSTIAQAYLRSDIPIICPIDMGRAMGQCGPANLRLAEPSILKSNGFRDPHEETKRRNHTIILIGCEKNRGPDAKALYHDTAIRPFMRATFAQLHEARCYTSPSMNTLDEASILPVTPSQVRLPLGHWRKWDEDGNSSQIYPGLIAIASRLQNGCFEDELPRYSGEDYDPGDFRLCRFRWPVPKEDAAMQVENAATRERLKGMLGKDGADIFEPLMGHLMSRIRGSAALDQWVWVQYQPHSVDPQTGQPVEALWLWNAERDCRARNMHTLEDLGAFLLGVYTKGPNGHWQPREIDLLFPATDRKLNLSLISSYSAIGIEAAVDAWPGPPRVPFADLYAFMQKDAAFFRDRYGLAHDMNSRGLLANLKGDANAASEMAEKVHAFLEPKGIVLKALATFLPGLASQDVSEAEECQKAMMFLLTLADTLNRKFEHRIHALEFVAGSMVEGVLPVVSNDGKESFATYMQTDHSKAIRRLVDRLGPVARDARERNLFLALEMEPGGSFVINDWNAIVLFCHLLENMKSDYSGDLSANVGVNLDIAHWTLAGIEPSDISRESTREGSDLVRKHIVHCHLSDHGRGHFADLAPKTINPAAHFHHWIDEIRNVCNTKFSRTLALELEACKNAHFIETSLAVLGPILYDMPGDEPKRLKFLIEAMRSTWHRIWSKAMRESEVDHGPDDTDR